MASGPLAHEVKEGRIGRRKRRLERAFPGARDGAGGQASVGVGAVGVGRVLVHLGADLAARVAVAARRALLEEAAVGGGRVRLQPRRPGDEARVTEAVIEGARHEGALLVDRGLALDDRGEGDDLLEAPAKLAGRGSDRGASGRELEQAAVEFLLQRAGNVAGVAVEGEAVGGREEVALQAVGAHPQLLEERRVGGGREEGALGADLALFEALGGLEAGPALGERHGDLLARGGAGQHGLQIARREVVGEEVAAWLEGRGIPHNSQVPGEESGAPDEPLGREQIGRVARGGGRRQEDLDHRARAAAAGGEQHRGEGQPEEGQEPRDRVDDQLALPGLAGGGGAGRRLAAAGRRRSALAAVGRRGIAPAFSPPGRAHRGPPSSQACSRMAAATPSTFCR